MVYTATKLITKAFYLAKVVARDLETVTGSELEDGLDLLNAELSFTATNPELIPYYSEATLNAVVGQEKYFIANLIEPTSFTFNINNVRYGTLYQGRNKYFGISRVDNIRSLPFRWHIERTKGGSDLYLYFVPSDTFVLKIFGKYGLTSVTASTDLELTYDLYYINYLKYVVASLIAAEWDIDIPAAVLRQLEIYKNRVENVSNPDLFNTKVSQLSGKNGLNWGDVNIGRGFRP